MAEKKWWTGTDNRRTWLCSVDPDGTTSVAGVSPNDGSVEIPSAIYGHSVTSIGVGSFYGCSGLISVTIPSSVTGIGAYAFYGCSGLEKIVFGGDAPFFEGEEDLFFEHEDLSVDEDLSSAVVNGKPDFPPSAVVYVKPDSTGWDVEIPGTWMGCRIEYVSAD